MKREKGFTLIELLVVMAIIAILASIVVPNVQRYIVRARLTKAIAEISGMDLSLTAIVTDAGRGNLGQLLTKGLVEEAVSWPTDLTNPAAFNQQLFDDAALLYSRIAYDLLRLGRDCLRDDPTLPLDMRPIAQLYINRDLLAQIGTNYMDIGLDPWGGTYRVWPGPWRYSNVGLEDPATRPTINGRQVTRWPIPFRTFSMAAGTGTGTSFAVQTDPFIFDTAVYQDYLSTITEDYATWPSTVSYPADGAKSVFIWSMGQNTRTSQMLYMGTYTDFPGDWFPLDAAGEDIGGGDDANNWDSGASWARFYM